MKITAIKAQVKNPDRVSIFVDEKYSFSLSLDQLLEQKIKKNDEVDEQSIKQLKKLSDESKLKARTLEWLMGRPHSIREFRDYLYRKKAEKDLVEAWVEEFTVKNYLNDERFARWFAENRLQKHKSVRAIQAELSAKGIPQATIKSVVNNLTDDETETNQVKALVNKLRNRSQYKDKQKLITHLQRKGFRYSTIRDVLDNN